MDAYVEVTSSSTLPGAAGMGQESSLVPHSAGYLQAQVLAMLADLPLYVGARTEKDTHVVTAKLLAPYSGAAHSASRSFPEYEDGVVQVDCPGSDIQFHPDVSGFEASFWLMS